MIPSSLLLPSRFSLSQCCISWRWYHPPRCSSSQGCLSVPLLSQSVIQSWGSRPSNISIQSFPLPPPSGRSHHLPFGSCRLSPICFSITTHSFHHSAGKIIYDYFTLLLKTLQTVDLEIHSHFTICYVYLHVYPLPSSLFVKIILYSIYYMLYIWRYICMNIYIFNIRTHLRMFIEA